MKKTGLEAYSLIFKLQLNMSVLKIVELIFVLKLMHG